MDPEFAGGQGSHRLGRGGIQALSTDMVPAAAGDVKHLRVGSTAGFLVA